MQKFDAFADWQRRARDGTRRRGWWLHADLKAYCRDPTAARKAQLKARFQCLITTHTSINVLDRLRCRLHKNRDALVMVLERPEVPLNTNGSENNIRAQATKRKISGSTRSDLGRDCREAFLSLMKTWDKLEVSFWAHLGDRLRVDAAEPLPPLLRIIQKAPAAS